MQNTAVRYSVTAMHKQTPWGQMVDYWRVEDAQTGLRANGTAQYETAERAQQWADALNEADQHDREMSQDPGTSGPGALPHG